MFWYSATVHYCTSTWTARYTGVSAIHSRWGIVHLRELIFPLFCSSQYLIRPLCFQILQPFFLQEKLRRPEQVSSAFGRKKPIWRASLGNEMIFQTVTIWKPIIHWSIIQATYPSLNCLQTSSTLNNKQHMMSLPEGLHT